LSKRLFFLFKKYKQFEDDVWGNLYMRGISTKLQELLQAYISERKGFRRSRPFFFFDVSPEKPKRERPNYSERGAFIMDRLKFKRYYGNITERQLKIISRASIQRKFTKYQNALFLLELESRLDSLVFRLQLVPTIFAARQFVMHGNCCVNGSVVTIPSFRLKRGDIFTLAQRFLWGDILFRALANEREKRLTGTYQMFRRNPNYLKISYKYLFLYFEKRPSRVEVYYPFVCKNKGGLNMYYMN
jgi:small subunit ribosomal protein S4